MIDCIFTVDYEIYGNGEGSLRDLVYEPAKKLRELFGKLNLPFVTFVEAAELEKIEENRADDAIDDVRTQILNLHQDGIEIGLHLHPQWCNARYENRTWHLDYSEYNICCLPRTRIEDIISSSIAYLRGVLQEPHYTPFSFRAGNWLMQPTETAAAVLASTGIKVDSSVFKGGFQRNHSLDYRPALKNGYYWPFEQDVNICASDGMLTEIPTYTEMVPFWKMITTKRVALQSKSRSSSVSQEKAKRLLDYVRFWYPLKLDFCRMSSAEMISMVEKVIREDATHPEVYRPLVAIGHTKDLMDVDAVASFLSYLSGSGIPVTTFKQVYRKCRGSGIKS